MKLLRRKSHTRADQASRRNRRRENFRRLSMESLEDRRLLAITFNYNVGTKTLTFDSDSDGDTLILESTGTTDEVKFNAGLGSLTQSDVEEVVYNGNGGADRLLISNPGGDIFAPVRGITFNGGAGADDIVAAGGDASFSGSYTPSGAGSGNLSYTKGGDTQSIDFNSVVQIDDSTQATSFTTDINGSGDTINVEDGPLLAPVQGFSQGPVLVDGGDRDDHGFFSGGNQAGWKFIEQSLNFLLIESFNSAALAGNDILSIGATGGDARAAVDSAAAALGVNVTHVTTVGGIASVDFDDYRVLYIPSNDNNTSGGISSANLAALAARKNDIADFVRNGGGVMAQTEQGDGALAFSWLEIPDAFTISGTTNNTMIQTPALAAAGFSITNAELTNGTPVHNDFTGPPGFNGLDVFVVNANNEIITLGQGAIQQTIGGGQALQINDDGTASFATINLANKVNIDVNAGGGADTITYDVTIPADGTTTVDINGEGQNDTITVENHPTGSTLTVDAGSGNDLITVGGIATLDGILGPHMVTGGGGFDVLTVDDSGDTDNNRYRVTGDSVSRNSGAPLVPYTDIEDLRVLAGLGEDDLDVNIDADTDADQPLSLLVDGGDGIDMFFDSSAANGKITPSLITTQRFQGGDPVGALPPMGNEPGDTLHLDMSGTTAPVIVDTIGGFAISQSHQDITFSEMETLHLCDNSGEIDNADIGDLYVRTTDNSERITFTQWNDGGIKLYIRDMDTGAATAFPQHFGLLNGDQVLNQILVYAQDGDDYVSAATHIVDVNGNPISVEFRGEDGDDYLTGADADDLLVGGPGDDRLLGGNGNNVMFGDGDEPDGDGIPIELATDGDDRASGRTGNDIIFGGGGNDYLYGDGGDDYIHAGSGRDYLDGGHDSDVLLGAAGDDTLSGSYGNDILLGGLGRDRIYGRDGDDVLLGGSGSDQVRGDRGDDLVVGGNASSVDHTTTDAALRAILADWVAGSPAVPAGLGSLLADGERDFLIGGSGADLFHDSVEDWLFDFRASDGDSQLP